ncbi:MAG: exo-alpha-sialidase [Lachnospiraceae bacterium]|nr:exo-alpha-sialidase [Lachnospiraceae bacterium]
MSMIVEKSLITGENRRFESAHASTLLELSDGRILAAWFGGSWEGAPDVAVWTAILCDGVWSEPVIAADCRGVACWNPVLFRGEDGRIVLYYKVGARIPEWKTWYVESVDEGLHFTEPKELVEGDGSGGRGPVKNKPIRLKDRTILAPASVEGALWDAFVDISHDDGRTWKKSGLVPLRRVGYQDQALHVPYSRHACYGLGIIQPTLWQDETGAVHMLCRSTSSRIFRSDSTDGGETWSLAYDCGMPNNNSGIDLAQMPDGRLVLACNPRENAPNYHKGARTPLALFLSEDNGDSWKEIAVIEDGPGGFSYPSVICCKNGDICMTYTWKRMTIGFCRIRL